MKQETLKLAIEKPVSWGSLVAALIMRAKVEHNRRGVAFTVREMAEIIDAADQARPVNKPARRKGSRDPIFDAIAEACGIDLDAPLTRGAGNVIGTAKRDILEASPDATPAEIHRRAEAMKAKFPGTPFGPMGLAKNWPSFPAPKVKTLPNGPEGWLARVSVVFPTCIYAKDGAFPITQETDYEWSRLPDYMKRKLQ